MRSLTEKIFHGDDLRSDMNQLGLYEDAVDALEEVQSYIGAGMAKAALRSLWEARLSFSLGVVMDGMPHTATVCALGMEKLDEVVVQFEKDWQGAFSNGTN